MEKIGVLTGLGEDLSVRLESLLNHVLRRNSVLNT